MPSGRLSSWWYDLQDSLWFIPALLTGAAVGLAVLMIRLDRALLARRGSAVDWLFDAGAAGAREVLSAIAGTMITVTGVVFSITIVALQLASSQFSPRVLRTFTGDRGNKLVLGVFIGTFTYCLLVLRTVREAPEDGAAFVPAASVTLAIGLAIVCIGFLIYYINHAAHSIRASVIIDRAASDTAGLIDELYPADAGRPAAPRPAWTAPRDPPAVVRAETGGYLQAIDAKALFDLADGALLTVRPEPIIGEYVLPGAVLANVWPAAALTPKAHGAIAGAMVLGPERTLQHDLELGIRQLADIAAKALSPGINDPTTAVICIDRLAEALVTLAHRGHPEEVRTGADGTTRLVLHGPSFGRLVGVAFAQLRHYGAADATVMEHVVTTLGRMTALVPPERREPLAREARLAVEGARQAIAVGGDRERVERAAAWAWSGDDGTDGGAAGAEPGTDRGRDRT